MIEEEKGGDAVRSWVWMEGPKCAGDVFKLVRVRVEEVEEKLPVSFGTANDAVLGFNHAPDSILLHEGCFNLIAGEYFEARTSRITLVELCNTLCCKEDHFRVIANRFHDLLKGGGFRG